MVFFALSKSGVLEYERLQPRIDRLELWVGNAVLTQEEISALRATGAAVSVFTAQIHPTDTQAVSHALDVIREHHPGETIWMETSAHEA